MLQTRLHRGLQAQLRRGQVLLLLHRPLRGAGPAAPGRGARSGRKEKAEGESSDLRKAESNARHSFDMLKQALTDQIAADTKDTEDKKAFKTECEEAKATADGDLAGTVKDLADDEKVLATAQSTCTPRRRPAARGSPRRAA